MVRCVKQPFNSDNYSRMINLNLKSLSQQANRQIITKNGVIPILLTVLFRNSSHDFPRCLKMIPIIPQFFANTPKKWYVPVPPTYPPSPKILPRCTKLCDLYCKRNEQFIRIYESFPAGTGTPAVAAPHRLLFSSHKLCTSKLKTDTLALRYTDRDTHRDKTGLLYQNKFLYGLA